MPGRTTLLLSGCLLLTIGLIIGQLFSVPIPAENKNRPNISANSARPTAPNSFVENNTETEIDFNDETALRAHYSEETSPTLIPMEPRPIIKKNVQQPIPNQLPLIPTEQKSVSTKLTQQHPNQTTPLYQLIRKYMPNATPAEISLRQKALKSMPLATAELMLEIGSVVPPLSTDTPKNPQAKSESPQPQLPPLPTISQTINNTEFQATIQALQTGQRILANNIANAKTIGYKRQQFFFVTNSHTTLGTTLITNSRNWKTGTLKKTERQYDLAITGNGFFALQTTEPQPKNKIIVTTQPVYKTPPTVYSRCGRFTLNAQRELGIQFNEQFYRLVPTITLPTNATALHIQPNGTVSATIPSLKKPHTFGKIELTRFPNQNQLHPIGNSLFTAPHKKTGTPQTDSPGKNGCGLLQQYCLENSNVDLQQEKKRFQELTEQRKLIQKITTQIAPKN